MKQNEWMNDPLVAGIDTAKLQFLQMLVFEGQNLKKEQMLPFLMSIAKKGKNQNISFEKYPAAPLANHKICTCGVAGKFLLPYGFTTKLTSLPGT